MQKQKIERLLISIVFIGIILGGVMFFSETQITGFSILRTQQAANFGIYLIILGIVISIVWFVYKNKKDK